MNVDLRVTMTGPKSSNKWKTRTRSHSCGIWFMSLIMNWYKYFMWNTHTPENYVILDIPLKNTPFFQRILEPIPPSLYRGILNNACIDVISSYF